MRRAQSVPAGLVVQCDRCGRDAHPSDLQHDGLGHICPSCAVGRRARAAS